MLKRKAHSQMMAWYKAGATKALLVKGARQVGKSYLVKEFAKQVSSSVVVFDLIKDISLKDSFSQATSADDLHLRFSIASSEELIPGESIIIIDEVQECPAILTFIKYLVQKGDYRYILTGSLLGVKLNNIDSIPVGFVTQVQMYPLDFEEFCWANGVSRAAWSTLAESFQNEQPLDDFPLKKFNGLFHRYLMVGGMPDAVVSFLELNNIDAVRTVHQDIRSLYLEDITKHAPEELRLILRDIFRLIPAEASSKTRRFKLSSLQDVKRFTQVQQHFLWLTQAGVALPVYNVSAPVSPLLVAEQRNLFKLFYLDAGILASCFPKNSYAGLLEGESTINMGAVYEAFVAQELAAHGFDLRYFTSKKVGELDFIEEDALGKVIAFEVKSGSDYLSHASLDAAIATKGYTIDDAVVLAEKTNVKREGDILYLPVFMVGLFEHNDK